MIEYDVLECRHAVGTNGFKYFMKCTILKRMPGHRLKIRVFGDRYWPGNNHKSYIRYVPEFRVRHIQDPNHIY